MGESALSLFPFLIRQTHYVKFKMLEVCRDVGKAASKRHLRFLMLLLALLLLTTDQPFDVYNDHSQC